MKIACLLGVSSYDNCDDLPAGGRDLDLVHTLLNLTEEYEQVCRIDGNQPSSKVKQELVSFLKQFQGKAVDQVLFYFTGHGEFDGSEFNYVLSDFDPTKKKQTVIENSELDNWLRPLNPVLTVKIVDACHAGVQYIKDPTIFQKSLNKTVESFQSCYFLFSSQKEQYSFQSAFLSDFTHSLVKSVANYHGTEMRFKDIIDYISDEFAANPQQTPFFVTQASNMEMFTPVTLKLRTRLETELAKGTTPAAETGETDSQEPPPVSFVERAKAEAQKYCTLEEVISHLVNIQNFWRDHTYPDDVSSLYDFQSVPLQSLEGDVPSMAAIGKWLTENEHNYFACATSREVPVDTGGLGFHLGSTLTYPMSNEIKTRTVITGFRLTQDIDCPAIRISAIPALENLSWHDCHTTYVFSKTEIRIFYLFSTFRELNWEDRRRNADGKWRMLTVDFKSSDGLLPALKIISSAFVEHVMGPVQARFDVQDAPEKSDADQQNDQETGTPPKA